ncbi:MAG: hypothetical protein DIU78_001590 [Pseudomonadota bacterium]
MASQQETARGRRESAGNRSNPARGIQASRSAAASGAAERDEVYGLVSVLYHSLQGAETYSQYIDDARRAGDHELVEFFEDCREEESDRATRAKLLLAMRLDVEEMEEEDEDEDEEDEDEDEEDEEEDE